MKKLIQVLSVSIVAIIMSGCASVKYGDKDTEATLKKLQAVPDKVSLYVCRDKAFFGGNLNAVIFVDNSPIGTLKTNTFAHVLVSPGKHEVFLKTDGLSVKSGILNVDAKSGEIAFVWAGTVGGWFGTLTVDNFTSTGEAEQCVKEADYAVRAE